MWSFVRLGLSPPERPFHRRAAVRPWSPRAFAEDAAKAPESDNDAIDRSVIDRPAIDRLVHVIDSPRT